VRRHHHVELARVQLDAVLPEQLGRLVALEGQIPGPDLGQATVDSPALQPKRGIGSADEHDPQIRRAMLDEGAQRVQRPLVSDLLQVVEDQDGGFGAGVA
jgi:hypothetical protein